WGEKLLSLEGSNPDTYYLVATILTEKNDTGKAESTLKRALYLNPHHLLSHFLMGNIAKSQGKKGAALKHFKNAEELLSAHPDDEIVPGSEGLTAGRMRMILNKLS
ncbi:MAG: chemotaxis protein CheR, partial [Bacteroidota bacterium]